MNEAGVGTFREAIIAAYTCEPEAAFLTLWQIRAKANNGLMNIQRFLRDENSLETRYVPRLLSLRSARPVAMFRFNKCQTQLEGFPLGTFNAQSNKNLNIQHLPFAQERFLTLMVTRVIQGRQNYAGSCPKMWHLEVDMIAGI
jgi:hypothetical protein